jgi:hypothetical protein
MSSIDSADNIHCANVHIDDIILPVYWVITPLEHDVTSAPITKRDLVIGGGNGEHPMLQIRNADLLPLWLMSRDDIRDVEGVFKECEDLYFSKIMERLEDSEKETFKNYFPHAFEYFYCPSEWPLSSSSKIQKSYEVEEKSRRDKEMFLAKNAETAFLIDIAIYVMFDMPTFFFEEDVYRVIPHYKTEFKAYNFSRITHFSRPLKSSALGKVIINGTAWWGYDLDKYIADLALGVQIPS